MQLLDQDPQSLNGEYNLRIYLNGGTCTLQMRDTDDTGTPTTWLDIPGVDPAVPSILTVGGEVQAVLTGAAQCFVTPTEDNSVRTSYKGS